MSTRASQCYRVLQAARNAGPRGISSADFGYDQTIDGGPAIARLAARILDLTNRGCVFADGGRRNKLKVYVLESCPAALASSGPARPSDVSVSGAVSPDGSVASFPPAVESSGEPLQLFTEQPVNAIYGFERAA